MSNDKHHIDKKFEPTDDNEHSNKHSDDSETTDSAFSDCSSESGSSSKQIQSGSDYSLDSGRDSDCTSKTSSNSFPEIDKASDSSYSSLDYPSYHDSGRVSKELPSSDVKLLSHGTNCSSLDNLSEHDGESISKTSISDATSSHYSLNGNNVPRKVTSCYETDYDRKTKSSPNYGDSSVGKKYTEVKLHSNKVTGVTKLVQSDKMKKLSIPLHKRAKKDYPSTEKIKQGLSMNILKDSLYNTPYTNGTINRSLISKEVSKKLVKYMVKCYVKELVAELNRQAAIANASDSIATIEDCLKNLNNELDDIDKNLPEVTLSTIGTTLGMQINDFKVKLMDLVRFEMIVQRDTNYQQSDTDWDLLYEKIIGDAEKKHSVKNAAKEVEDCPNSPVIRQDLIVMHSNIYSEDSNDNGSQENQAEGQGDEADAPADAAGQEAQAGEPFEDVDISNNQVNSEEYLIHHGQSASEEEGTRERAEIVFDVLRPARLPKKSALVTFSSCSYYSAHLAEDQDTTSMNFQYQRFSEILTAKGVSVETIMQFVYTTAGYIPTWEFHIAELLSSIVVVINNAEDVLAIGNICKWLPEIIQEALKLMETRPIPVTEYEDSAPLTSVSYGRSRKELRDFRPSETTYASLHNRLMESVNSSADNFKVTCCPLQDTNDDIGYEDADSTNLIAFDYYNSAPACCTNEVEVYELHGYSYHCCMCGVLMCRGERIVTEINVQLDRMRTSVRRDDLLATLTTAVSFNTNQNCMLEFLQTRMPLEMLQRNLMLGCQEPQVFAILKYVIDPMILSRVRNFISSFISSHCTTVSSFMGTYQPPVIQPDALPHTTANREGSIFLANVLNWIDRSFNQSVLQPFVRAIAASRYVSLHNEYTQRIFSSLLSNLLPNSLSAKLSISVTVVPNDVSVNMDQFTSGLMGKHVTCRHQYGIFGLLRLPPVDTISSAPLTVTWTVTIESSNLLQLDFSTVQSTDPVEAVDQNNRESLFAVLQSTYSYHEEEQNDNFIGDFNYCVESPFSDPSDWNKTNRLDIFSYFPAENSSYIHHPSDTDTITNTNQINSEAQEATVSDDSSDSETED